MHNFTFYYLFFIFYYYYFLLFFTAQTDIKAVTVLFKTNVLRNLPRTITCSRGETRFTDLRGRLGPEDIIFRGPATKLGAQLFFRNKKLQSLLAYKNVQSSLTLGI